MKKLIILTLCVLLISASLFAGCRKEPEHVPEGPTIVDYGDVAYTEYKDANALSFSYLDCFKRISEEGQSFVANTSDGLGVLIYEFFDSFKDYENTDEYYKVPEKKYADIAAFSNDEAMEFMKLSAGMVSAQGAEYSIENFRFDKLDNYIRLSIEATATYEATGEVQNIKMVKYVVSNERVYTVQAFVPASCIEKYGPVIKTVNFDIENALSNGVNN